jgi:hypothetical protein
LVDIPGFLDINDFFGTFVPGYVAITLYLFLFYPSLILDRDAGLEADIFLAIVFIIAGPTIGLAVRQFQRTIRFLWSILWSRRKQADRDNANLFALEYAEVRILAGEQEKKELDRAEATMDFAISTATVLFGLVLYDIGNTLIFKPSIHVPIVAFSGILLAGSYLDWKYSFAQTYYRLKSKYNVNLQKKPAVAPASPPPMPPAPAG